MIRIILAVAIVLAIFGFFSKKPTIAYVNVSVGTITREAPPGISKAWFVSMKEKLPDVLRDYGDTIERESRESGYSPKRIAGHLMAESLGDPDAVNPKDVDPDRQAKGCMQTKRAAEIDTGMVGYNTSDCNVSITIGTKYLAVIRDRYGVTDPSLASIAYRFGHGNARHCTVKEARDTEYLLKIEAVMREIPPDTFL